MTRVVVTLGRRADVAFPALGSTVRLIAGGPAADVAVNRARAEILGYHRRLSRFLGTSELTALNRDPRAVAPASPLLRSAVRAGLWAAELTDGLVDPCLLDALEAAGYDRPYEPPAYAPLPGGPLRIARPDPAARWRSIGVDDDAGTIARPPGLATRPRRLGQGARRRPRRAALPGLPRVGRRLRR
jgi:FAD:protein FMN transferase